MGYCEREREEEEEEKGVERRGREGGRKGQQQPVELNTFVPEPDNGLRNSITRTAS